MKPAILMFLIVAFLMILMSLVLAFPAGATEIEAERTVLMSSDSSNPVNNPSPLQRLGKLADQLDLSRKNKADKRFGLKLRMNLFEVRSTRDEVLQRMYIKPTFGEKQTLKAVYKF